MVVGSSATATFSNTATTAEYAAPGDTDPDAPKGAKIGSKTLRESAQTKCDIREALSPTRNIVVALRRDAHPLAPLLAAI